MADRGGVTSPDKSSAHFAALVAGRLKWVNRHNVS